MRISEYQKLFGLRNKETGKLILFYGASSQKHKAIFRLGKKRLMRPDGLTKNPKLWNFYNEIDAAEYVAEHIKSK